MISGCLHVKVSSFLVTISDVVSTLFVMHSGDDVSVGTLKLAHNALAATYRSAAESPGDSAG